MDDVVVDKVLALAQLHAVHIGCGAAVLHHEENAIPYIGLEIAVVTQVAASAQLVVLEEEAGIGSVLGIGLQHRLIAVQIVEHHVVQDGVAVQVGQAGGGVHPEVAVAGHADSAVAFGRSGYEGYSGLLGVVGLFGSVGSLECRRHGCASEAYLLIHEAIGVVEGPPAQGLGCLVAHIELLDLNLLWLDALGLHGDDAFATTVIFHRLCAEGVVVGSHEWCDVNALDPVGQIEGEGGVGLDGHLEFQVVHHLDVAGLQRDKGSRLDWGQLACLPDLVVGDASLPEGQFGYVGIAHLAILVGQEIEAPGVDLPADIA